MTFLPRPNRGLLADFCAMNIRSEIVRVDHVVFTQAACDLAWKIFSNWNNWHLFSDVYGSEIKWKGAPWSPGSRLEFDILRPFRARVDRVITVCTPPRCVAWISHVRGYTMEQWILLNPYVGGGTKVSTWIEITGAELCPESDDVRPVLKGLLDTWFANYCAECDRLAEHS